MKMQIVGKYEKKDKEGNKQFIVTGLMPVLEYGIQKMSTVEVIVSPDEYKAIEVNKIYDIDFIMPKPNYPLKSSKLS